MSRSKKVRVWSPSDLHLLAGSGAPSLGGQVVGLFALAKTLPPIVWEVTIGRLAEIVLPG
jgi:hypothetical protein